MNDKPTNNISIMNKSFSIVAVMALLLIGSGSVQAQGLLGRVKNRVKSKIEQKINNAVDRAIDKTIDGATDVATDAVTSKKKNKKDDDYSQDYDPQEESNAKNTVGNVKNDFVPGNIVIFEDAVSGEQVGEFPSMWDLERGNAEVAVVNGQQVIEFANEDSWIKPLITKNPKNYFGDVFTIEFDLMYTDGDFEIDFMHPDSWRDHEIFTLEWGYNGPINLRYVQGSSESIDYKDGSSSKDQHTKLNNNRWHHYAISFNKRAIKTYVDGVRYHSVPNAKVGAGWMTFFFHGEKPAYMKNVRIARGGQDLYERKATDASADAIAKSIKETGKFVTNNILFDSGKAIIKAESNDEIQRVADYMKANPTARFEVQGHCDNKGSAASNDKLSQQRSEAIVNALVKLGVDEFNLKAVGKGSREPVASNATEEGRAQNRRVEFIKR